MTDCAPAPHGSGTRRRVLYARPAASSAESSQAGILAATPNAAAAARGYAAIFGRDAAICALGMAVAGDGGCGAKPPPDS